MGPRLHSLRVAPHRRCLADGDGVAAVLGYYPPFAAQPTHSHPIDQTTFVLLGGLHESRPGNDYEALCGWFGVKPAGCCHANRFGREGALLVTIETADDAKHAQVGWSAGADLQVVTGLVRTATDTAGSPLATEAIRDLLAGAVRPRPRPRIPPRALALARERLHEEPEQCRIDSLAKHAGFDRTTFARMFRRHFGIPPSIYRARRMTAVATRALLTERCSVADAAFAGGFADHSHYTRSVRRFAGVTPKQLRELLG